MSFLFSRNERSDAARRRRKTENRSKFVQVLETSPIIGFGIFLLVAAGFIALTLIGVSPLASPVIPGQIASVTIHSSLTFSYESQAQTEREQQRNVQRISPVFRPSMQYFESFSEYIRQLKTALNNLDLEWEDLSTEERDSSLSDLLHTMESQHRSFAYPLNTRNLRVLIEKSSAEERRDAFRTTLQILRQTHLQGIYHAEDFTSGESGEIRPYLFHHQESPGPARQTHQRLENAQRSFVYQIAFEGDQELLWIIRDIFRPGIMANLRYDEARTEALRDRERARTQPVVVETLEGEPIIVAGQMVTEEQHEKLQQYRRLLSQRKDSVFFFNQQIISRSLLVIGILLATVIYIRIEDRETLKSNSRLLLLGGVANLNLLIIWFLINLTGSGVLSTSQVFLAILPYLSPTTLAPLIVAVLVGQRPAIFMALMISFFTSLMFGNRVELFVVAFLSSLCAIYYCQQVRLRGRLVKASVISGTVIALSALVLGIVEMPPSEWSSLILTAQQALAAMGVGLLSGILLVGVLPILEFLFRRTTDITLLELSDTNHPLLKNMQLVAPGSYHHSLMVANLSENAAQSIGANGLLCRVCSLYHDIGKTVKPEYFIENQLNGINPHLDRSPSFSALVIKSHVKEGVDLAVNSKLPKVIIDVIRQHHGTSLIQYFYHLAKTRENQENNLEGSGDSDKVSESTYRYDGPKPQFRESAIIHFADCIEAASRSLKKVTPQSIDDLIARIVQSRIEDGQLDECPITFQEIAQMQKSFSYTLLNMFHSRIEYPKESKGKEATPSQRQGS